MLERIVQLVGSLEWMWRHALVVMGASAALGVASLGITAAALVGVPATYFLDSHDRTILREWPQVIRWTAMAFKNGAGVLLIAVGLIMSIPGVPGQGLLTILVGLIWTDFPGKRELERWCLSRPRLRGAVDALRQRFSRPPLIL